MSDNPIVDEVHRIREQLLEEYGGDLNALIADARRRTEEWVRQGSKVASPSRRDVQLIHKKKKTG